MPTYDTLFKTIEEYKDITIDALTYSKIGKGKLGFARWQELADQSVMKKIATQTNIARNDEFKITDRASKLMQDVSRAHEREFRELTSVVAECCRWQQDRGQRQR
jgi:hypothetical protein